MQALQVLQAPVTAAVGLNEGLVQGLLLLQVLAQGVILLLPGLPAWLKLLLLAAVGLLQALHPQGQTGHAQLQLVLFQQQVLMLFIEQRQLVADLCGLLGPQLQLRFQAGQLHGQLLVLLFQLFVLLLQGFFAAEALLPLLFCPGQLLHCLLMLGGPVLLTGGQCLQLQALAQPPQRQGWIGACGHLVQATLPVRPQPLPGISAVPGQVQQ